MRLIYKGDGDYDAVFDSGAAIELSYDGSDYAVGDWTFWAVRIGNDRIGGTQILGAGDFVRWLEQEARGEGGRLSDEPTHNVAAFAPQRKDGAA
jgi:hypothetical protein